jgi:HNH endonuclease
VPKRKSTSRVRVRHTWSEEEKEKIRLEYPHRVTKELAEEMGVAIGPLYQMAAKLGVLKTDAYWVEDVRLRIERGRVHPKLKENQFKKGQKAWNEGIKGSTGTHPNSRRTQFKKGQRSGAANKNWVPIGTERLSKEGYLERKVTDDPQVQFQRRWVGVHRLVWEAAHGPVPKGHMVCFLPGKKTNVASEITIDILELVSRRERARRNHPISKSPELARLTQLKGAITRQLNRIVREAKEKDREQHERLA